MASRPWGVSKYEIPVKPEPSLPRGSQNWLDSCYKQEYLVISVCIWGLSAIVAGCVWLKTAKNHQEIKHQKVGIF